MDNIPYTLSVWAIPVILAITLHEAAHAWTAHRLGDPTAARLGRVSFNPIRHIDPFGTLLLPALLLFTGSPFLFGWAKPVPVIVQNLGNMRRDMAAVAMAGPLMNFGLAFIGALGLRMALPVESAVGEWCVLNLKNLVVINVLLAIFNLLPLLPLDGGRIVNGFLPPRLAAAHARTEKYGFFILIGLLVLPSLTDALGFRVDPLWTVLRPILSAGMAGFFGLAGG